MSGTPPARGRSRRRPRRRTGSDTRETLRLALEEAAARDAGRAAAEAALAASEARFRSLTSLSSDWFWEQDADFRFIARYDMSAVFAEDIGRCRWELPLLGVTPAQWDEHRAVLQAHRPFRDFAFARVFPDGRLHHLCVSGEPIFDAAGCFNGYRGIGRDITRERRTERMRRLEHRVAMILGEALSADFAISAILEALCREEGWDCGRYWRRDGDSDAYRAAASWHDGNPAIAQFFAETGTKVFRPGLGGVGIVAQTKKPHWIADIESEPRVLNLSGARRIGLRSTCMFPVLLRGQVIGVFAFISQSIREPDDVLLAAAQTIGGHLAQFLERLHKEDALRQSEARYRALAEMSSEWYWETDADDRFVRMSDHVVSSHRAIGFELLGKTRWDTGIEYDESERASLEADIAARRPFREFHFTRNVQGTIRHVQISGEPIFDVDGTFGGYRGVGRDVTERHRRDNELKRFRAAMDATADAIYLSDLAGTRFLDVNAAACRMLGYERDALLALAPRAVFSTADWDPQSVQRMLTEGATDVQEIEAVCAPSIGDFIPVELLRRAHDGGSEPIIVGVARDIRARIHAEREIRVYGLQQSLMARFGQRALVADNLDNLFADALNIVGEGLECGLCAIWLVDDAGHLAPAHVKAGSQPLPAEVEPAMRGAPPVHASVLGGKSVLIGDTPARSGDVADRWLRSRNIRSCAEVLIGEPDRPIGVLAAHSNEPSRFNGSTIVFLQAIANTLAAASARHAASQRLSHLAQFDQLSGLANRALFDERLQHALTRARAVSTKLGVLFIDLDDFKLVNDRHGHQVGDQLLVHVAQRLQQCIRNEDTVGRIGGDEFAIVLTGLDSDADVRLTSRRIVDALERPFEIGDVVVRVGASIGVAVAPDDGVDHTALLKQADMAMYAEKGRRGRRTG